MGNTENRIESYLNRFEAQELGLKVLSPLFGITSPEKIIPLDLQKKIWKLSEFFNNWNKRFWISFWLGVCAVPLYLLMVILAYKLFGNVFFEIFPFLAVQDKSGFLKLFYIIPALGTFISFQAIQSYCISVFKKADEIYFSNTDVTGEMIEEAIIFEVEKSYEGRYFPNFLKEKKSELKRQKFKAYVAYAFYELKIPVNRRKYKKIPIDD
jgi:hypothetical protein